MLPPEVERQLETETIALNRWIFDEGVGLPVDSHGYEASVAALTELYARTLAGRDGSELLLHFALDNWAEMRRVPLDYAVNDRMDEVLTVPGLRVGGEPLTWRTWREFDIAAGRGPELREAFDELVQRAGAFVPELEARLDRMRADFRPYGLTPVDSYCFRERITVEQLRQVLERVGQACREPFAALLDDYSRRLFGRPAGPAELRAICLNRMYDLDDDLFAGVEVVPDTLRAFRQAGFDLSGVELDLEPRPRKYPGAYCVSVSIPGDVRVGMQLTAPHYLIDTLYHEFGHAANFSRIRRDLPFIDRYWIQSGTHEVFSTLFEYLLGEPLFLREHFGFEEPAIRRMLAFHRFKALVTGTWVGASALAALEAWTGDLDWRGLEACYAKYIYDFTGVNMPPGFARLEMNVSLATIYPAGYVLAAVRLMHWLRQLRAEAGERWWATPTAQETIRAAMQIGGTLQFPAPWQAPDEFIQAFC